MGRWDNAWLYLIDAYPLTIIRDRYDGTYSGGKYTAWNLSHCDVPEEIDADDVTCHDFWINKSKEYLVGVGDTIQEAVEILLMSKRNGEKENVGDDQCNVR